MALPEPDPCDESALAQRLLVALEKGETDQARQIQGEIFGLHFAKLKAYVASRLTGQPDAHVEEVFGNAAEKMFKKLRQPEWVAWVTPGRSFAPGFFKIARFETVDYWQSNELDKSRPSYRDDRLSVSGLDSGLFETGAADDAFERVEEIDEASAEAALIMEAAQEVGGLDELLFTLRYVEEISLPDVERLLVLAEREDAEKAAREARALPSVDDDLGEQYLDLIRECPAAHPMNYNNLKVAVHRALNRVRDHLDPDDAVDLDDPDDELDELGRRR